RGATFPIRFSESSSICSYRLSCTGSAPPISARRCSIWPPWAGDRAMAPAVISSVTKTNASRGSRMTTSHLDPDDLTDPEEAHRLHHRGTGQHRPAERVREERLHVIRADEGERDTESGRQRQQHISGESPVRGVNLHLAQQLEAVAHDR